MEAWARGQWGERLEVQVERGGTFLSKRQGYLSKNSQENSIESTQTYCSGIMAQVYFLLLRGTMVDVANFLDVYTDSILQFLVLLMLSWPCRKCNFW